jgi:hypothetical protein
MVGEDQVAHPVLIQRSLGDAVKDVMGSEDREGVAHALLPTIRELFRTMPKVEEATPGSGRARRVYTSLPPKH